MQQHPGHHAVPDPARAPGPRRAARKREQQQEDGGAAEARGQKREGIGIGRSVLRHDEAARPQQREGERRGADEELGQGHGGHGAGTMSNPVARCQSSYLTPEKSRMTLQVATRILRVVAGVLRLRPTKRGSPPLMTAPTAAMSPFLIAASAVSCCRHQAHR